MAADDAPRASISQQILVRMFLALEGRIDFEASVIRQLRELESSGRLRVQIDVQRALKTPETGSNED